MILTTTKKWEVWGFLWEVGEIVTVSILFLDTRL